MKHYITEAGFASVFGHLETEILGHLELCFAFLKMAAELASERKKKRKRTKSKGR